MDMKKLMVGIGIFTLVGSSLVFADGFSTSNAPKYDPKVTYAYAKVSSRTNSSRLA